MALLKDEKADLVKKFQKGENDTGSSEVQIALLTENINTVSYTHLTLPTNREV